MIRHFLIDSHVLCSLPPDCTFSRHRNRFWAVKQKCANQTPNSRHFTLCSLHFFPTSNDTDTHTLIHMHREHIRSLSCTRTQRKALFRLVPIRITRRMKRRCRRRLRSWRNSQRPLFLSPFSPQQKQQTKTF